MPVRRGTNAPLAKFYRGTTEIDHLRVGISPHEGELVFSRPSLPVITSFSITPSAETGAQRTTRNSPLTATWDVEGVTTSTSGKLIRFSGRGRDGRRDGDDVAWDFYPTGYAVNRFRGRLVYRFPSGQNPATVTVDGAAYPFTDRLATNLAATGRNALDIANGSTVRIQVTNADGTLVYPVTSTTVYPTLALAFTTADGTRTTYTATADTRGQGTASIPTPAQDGVATLTATNVEGPVHAQARYDFRTPLGSLSVSISGYRAQSGAAAATQEAPIVRCRWQGDPITNATVGFPGASPVSYDLSRTEPSGIAYDTERTFVVPFGDQATRHTITLTVVGVNANNLPASMVAQTEIVVPARAGG